MKLPPLRERPQDLETLAEAFLAEFARDLGKPAPRLDPEAAALLRGYAWPGNVRELRNLMERTAVLSNGARHPAVVRSLAAARRRRAGGRAT